ncbi:MAG: DUF1599 domain-containing protein [Saprospiraceae bacterium]|nr:DUF1599 domain-containing protein [Saprospiraceae bacterium]
MNKTIEQYRQIQKICQSIFAQKAEDYGTSWRILRPSSVTDQLLIKAFRIRSIEEQSEQLIDEMPDVEYVGLINYSIMALIQLDLGSGDKEIEKQEIVGLYNNYFNKAFELMLKKNHDYGEIWRQMRMSSFTDLILSKILRIRRIEKNQGKTIISEGAASNYLDIINYAVFALIIWSENKAWSFKF